MIARRMSKDARGRIGEGGAHRLGGVADLAGDVTSKPAEAGAHANHLAAGLAVAAAMGRQLRHLAPGLAADACAGLARR